MCGISGFATVGKRLNVAPMHSAHRLLRHRGPDDEGFVVDGANGVLACRGDDTVASLGGMSHINDSHTARVFLGHSRLSIIDLSDGGHQPMTDDTGRYHLVYNGEVFNYVELRRELESLGHRFRTASDTEVVLQALTEWWTDAFARFNGMWALAVWDSRTERLLLARDRFGIKPLFLATTPDAVYFASEVKALRRVLGSGSLNADAAIRYLDSCLLNDRDETFWEDVSELPPAHWAIWDGGRLDTHRYWEVSLSEDLVDEREAVDRFGSLFEDSLRLRMRSDVQVGTLLSGGLDSSLVVCTLDRLGMMAEGVFESFSAVFAEERFSERRYVEELVRELPLKPHYVTPAAEEVECDLDGLLAIHDQPFRSLAVYSQQRLYETVASESSVKVLLNGQGADELFGGYNRHYYVLLGELAARLRLGAYLREARQYSRARGASMWRIARNSLGHIRKAFGMPHYFASTLLSELTESALREYLTYEDRNSMSVSVESRVPFLDYRLVEFAFSLDASLKIRGVENKRVERLYARGVVPNSIASRTDKMGFVSPQEVWQRGKLGSMIESARPNLERWVQSGFALGRQDLLHRFDRYLADPDSVDWAFGWRVSCLARWMRLNGLNG